MYGSREHVPGATLIPRTYLFEQHAMIDLVSTRRFPLPHAATRWFGVVTTAMLIVSGSGCGDPNRQIYPVSGVVKFPDGKLLRSGSVEFEIIGRKPAITATGVISSDGRFVLGTHKIDDGALIGRHRVVVISYYDIGNGAERPGRIPKPELHPRYSQYRTSGLIWEVKPEENEVVIEVDYADDFR